MIVNVYYCDEKTGSVRDGRAYGIMGTEHRFTAGISLAYASTIRRVIWVSLSAYGQ